MTIDRSVARQRAAEHVGEGRRTAEGFTPVILDDQTLERDFGWVFFYESKEYLASGDFSDQLLGNAPLIVDRDDGSVHVTGTAQPIEVYLRRYAEARTKSVSG